MYRHGVCRRFEIGDGGDAEFQPTGHRASAQLMMDEKAVQAVICCGISSRLSLGAEHAGQTSPMRAAANT